MNQLVELAEDNFELSFGSIFRNRLADHNAEVRSKAIEGLWKNEGAFLTNPLTEPLEQDSLEKLQAAATIVPGKFVMLVEFNESRTCHCEFKVGEAPLSFRLT